jgi:hypothetical protein
MDGRLLPIAERTDKGATELTEGVGAAWEALSPDVYQLR